MDDITSMQDEVVFDLLETTLLLVEDQLINREMLKSILSDRYQLLTAEDGIEALEILEREHDRISLVITDIVMPRLDGFGLIEAMHSNDTYSAIPIIVATNQSDIDSELKALALGANDFLRKPYNPELIRHRVASTLRLVESVTTIKQVEREALTSLYTKEFFSAYCQDVLKTRPDAAYDLVDLNINNFKLANELYGEKTADAVLAQIGNELYKEARELKGMATRTGGDDFVMFLPRREDYDTYLPNLEARLMSNEDLPKMKLRFGVLHIDDSERKLPGRILMDHVRIANDHARGILTRPYVTYDSDLRSQLVDEQELVSTFDTAIREGQFKVYYQPKYRLSDETLVGAEALVRWIHPDRGFMSPGLFIPLFEKNGLINRLDNFVWETTCQNIARWTERFGKCVPISVNVSRTDIYQPDLVGIFKRMVADAGIAMGSLSLEVTESAYINDPEDIINIVSELHEAGFPIEMDDFGTGYSSLSMLTTLPFDILKLDMSFLEADFSPEDPGMIGFVLELAKWLDVKIIAEGVETKEQAQNLREMGCNYAQGYYYSKPVPQEEFEEKFLASWA